MRIFFVCLAVIIATACTPRSVTTPTTTPAGDYGATRTAEITEALRKGSYTSKGEGVWEGTYAVAHVIKETDNARVDLLITRPTEGRVECKVVSTGAQLLDDLKRLPNRSVHDLITKYGCLAK